MKTANKLIGWWWWFLAMTKQTQKKTKIHTNLLIFNYHHFAEISRVLTFPKIETIKRNSCCDTVSECKIHTASSFLWTSSLCRRKKLVECANTHTHKYKQTKNQTFSDNMLLNSLFGEWEILRWMQFLMFIWRSFG